MIFFMGIVRECFVVVVGFFIVDFSVVLSFIFLILKCLENINRLRIFVLDCGDFLV